jgi:hypothetical protein
MNEFKKNSGSDVVLCIETYVTLNVACYILTKASAYLAFESVKVPH